MNGRHLCNIVLGNEYNNVHEKTVYCTYKFVVSSGDSDNICAKTIEIIFRNLERT